jgi:SAM-dependent methyltransferase
MDQEWRGYHARWEGSHWLARAMEHWEFHRKFHRKLAAHLERGDSLLDIGSGKGYSALYFAANGHPVTGIDPDPASVEEANAWATRFSLPARFLEGDIFTYRPEGRFRMSYSMGLIEHFPADQAVRMLSIQGELSDLVVALAPTSHSLRTVEPCSIPWTPQTFRTLRRSFEAAGLEIAGSFGAGQVWSRWEGRLHAVLPPAVVHLLQNRVAYAMNVAVVGRRRG